MCMFLWSGFFLRYFLFFCSLLIVNLEVCILDKVLFDKWVFFVFNVEFGESVFKDFDDELINDFEFEFEDVILVWVFFEILYLSIKFCGEFNKVEFEFVDIVFYDFFLSYEYIRLIVILVDVFFGGFIVEDLF